MRVLRGVYAYQAYTEQVRSAPNDLADVQDPAQIRNFQSLLLGRTYEFSGSQDAFVARKPTLHSRKRWRGTACRIHGTWPLLRDLCCLTGAPRQGLLPRHQLDQCQRVWMPWLGSSCIRHRRPITIPPPQPIAVYEIICPKQP